MYGTGFFKGMWVTLRHFMMTYVDDLRYGMNKYAPEMNNFEVRQGTQAKGAFTVQYPDEKLAMPERFRFVPFLVVEDYDHAERPGKDWCTSCGICSKVCPPQCIWIVRSNDPETGRPVPEPEAFFIDIDICMNCGFCAEFCPFDAIKMDHDYELASYDRTTNHVFDKPKLSKELRYWRTIAPTRSVQEMEARGSWDHKDVEKEKRRGGSSRKSSKRDTVRERKEQRAAEKAETKAAPVKEAAAEKAAAPAAAEGSKPWTDSEDMREKRKQAALARKAARAAKRAAQES